MYYGAVPSIVVLTRNDLKHAVLLHVGREVPSSHVLFHYANIGQLLMGENTSGIAKFALVSAEQYNTFKNFFLHVAMGDQASHCKMSTFPASWGTFCAADGGTLESFS